MRNFLLPLALVLLPLFASAQLSDLLKNPNIAWAATFETEHDFRLSNKSETSKIQLTKFSLPENACVKFLTDNWLANWFLEEMKSGHYKLYGDPTLSLIVSHSTFMDRVTTIDTVVTFDPNSYEERMQVIRNDINADDIVGFRTQQAIYFDKKTGNYDTRLLGLAPLVKQTDPTGAVIGKLPLAWLPMYDVAAAGLTDKNPDVIWSALLIDKANSLEISKLKTVKNELKKDFSEQIFQEVTSMKHPVESSAAFGCGNLLTKSEIEHLTTEIDTIITFDPVTFKETMQIVKNAYNPAALSQVVLAQEWYFDNRRKLLANRLKAIAPYVEVLDANKKLLYNRIEFYLHF